MGWSLTAVKYASFCCWTSPQRSRSKYKLTEEEQNSIITKDQRHDILMLMDIIAKKTGSIVSGGEIDYEKVANIILNDFRTGKIGRITLEQVHGNK